MYLSLLLKYFIKLIRNTSFCDGQLLNNLDPRSVDYTLVLSKWTLRDISVVKNWRLNALSQYDAIFNDGYGSELRKS